MRYMIALVILALTLTGTPAFAIDFTGTGITGDLTYTEPSTNSDGTPLTDLDRTEYRIDNGAGTVTPSVTVPASSPTGGQLVTVPNVTIPLPSSEVMTLATIYVRACDNALSRGANDTDNCSPEVTLTKPIDTLKPDMVQ